MDLNNSNPVADVLLGRTECGSVDPEMGEGRSENVTTEAEIRVRPQQNKVPRITTITRGQEETRMTPPLGLSEGALPCQFLDFELP